LLLPWNLEKFLIFLVIRIAKIPFTDGAPFAGELFAAQVTLNIKRPKLGVGNSCTSAREEGLSMPQVIAAPSRNDRVLAMPLARGSDPAILADEELLAEYRSTRSQAAFSALLERHGPMVNRLCRRILGNKADAEDVVQAVFLLLARRPELVRRSVSGWLHETARGRAINELRARQRRVRREEVAASRPAAPQKLATGLAEELGAALHQLRTRLRQAVVLRYVEGRSLAEAAQAAGCPAGTMGRRSMEGLRQLRSIMTRRAAAALSALLAIIAGHTKLSIAAVVAGISLTVPLVQHLQQPQHLSRMITALEEIPEPNLEMMRKHFPAGTKFTRGWIVVDQGKEKSTIASYACGETPAGQFNSVYAISLNGQPWYLTVNGQRVFAADGG
jgi:RNA polymerase sigma factor (sigma-70 family)